MEINFSDPKYYTNRELSWVLFDHRVLNEARDKNIPLFERLKFLSITASNLDEFFMIRVASLKDMENAGYTKKDIAGMTPTEQLKALHVAIHELVDLQYSTYNRSLLPLLEKNGLHIIREHEQLTAEEAAYVDQYFQENVYPVLTPMAVDSSRPFPLIRNKSLNIGAMVRKKNSDEELEFATVQVPSVLSRVVRIPSKGKSCKIILLEEIIERNMDKLFLNYDIVCAHPFRIMRNADLSIDEDEAADLLKEIEKQLKKRQWGEAIRLEVESGMDKRLLKIIKKELNIETQNIYEIDGPLDLTVLMKIYGLDGFDHLKTPKYEPQQSPALPAGCNIFEEIRKGDILLHHPFQSFTPVVDFIRQAARDPEVLAIKQTLYRVSGNSPIIAALAQAAENGKQVTVLVELKARFDEENNMSTAERMEQAGIRIIYSIPGLKVHAKVAVIIRKDPEDGNKRRDFAYLSTGNFNEKTARVYSDMALLTCNDEIITDINKVFAVLEGKMAEPTFRYLLVARFNMVPELIRMIHREIEHVKLGRKGRIVLKMNGLHDQNMINELYHASENGVEIDLIVRGICCLVPGQPYSANIRITRIVDMFLEHSRIWYFYNDGKEDVYLTSADWMRRNLNRRIETAFPILVPEIKQEVIDILKIQMRDNVKACLIDEQLHNNFKHNEEPVKVRSQLAIYEYLKNKS